MQQRGARTAIVATRYQGRGPLPRPWVRAQCAHRKIGSKLRDHRQRSKYVVGPGAGSVAGNGSPSPEPQPEIGTMAGARRRTRSERRDIRPLARPTVISNPGPANAKLEWQNQRNGTPTATHCALAATAHGFRPGTRIASTPPGPAEDQPEPEAARQHAIVAQRRYGIRRVAWAHQRGDKCSKQQDRLQYKEVADSSAQDSHRSRRLAAHGEARKSPVCCSCRRRSQPHRRALRLPRPHSAAVSPASAQDTSRDLSAASARPSRQFGPWQKMEKPIAADQNGDQPPTGQAEAGMPHPEKVAPPPNETQLAAIAQRFRNGLDLRVVAHALKKMSESPK